MQAELDMPLEELRRQFEHLGDVTGENAEGVPRMWAIPKGCEQSRSCCARMAVAM